MKILYTFFLASILFCLAGCSRTSESNSRIYIEGKMSGNLIAPDAIEVKIVNEGLIISETKLASDYGFKLSGPLVSSGYCELQINKKIKSFSASKPGCILNSDSKSIQIPAGTTYLIFNEIVLE